MSKLNILNHLPRSGAVKEGEVLHESGTEGGHPCPGVWVDGCHVGDILDVVPRLGVWVVCATVINVLSHKLSRYLIVVLVDLHET